MKRQIVNKLIDEQGSLQQLEPYLARWCEKTASRIEGDGVSAGDEGGYRPPEAAVLYDAVVAMLLGKNVLLKGPTGSGKTKLAEYLSWLFDQPLHAVNCSVDLDTEALLGFKTLVQRDGHTEVDFVAGPVITAMNQGHFLYIDEINMAKPETLPIINGILDHRRMITNPFTGQVVRGTSGFNVIAAINVGYVGTVPMNEALKNRFVVIDVPYLQGEKLEALIRETSLLQDMNTIRSFVQFSADLIALIRMGQMSDEAASIRALLDACDLAPFLSPKRAIQRAIIDKLDDEREQAAIRNIADTIFIEVAGRD